MQTPSSLHFETIFILFCGIIFLYFVEEMEWKINVKKKNGMKKRGQTLFEEILEDFNKISSKVIVWTKQMCSRGVY